MRGKPSLGHEYDKQGQCTYCGMYRVSVEAMNHVCIPEREKWSDEQYEIQQAQAQLKEAQNG